MKTSLLICSLFILFLGCNKDDDRPVNPVDQLPPATQIGADKAGCLVNGQAFIPKGYIQVGNLNCNYIDGENFSLRISENINGTIRNILITSHDQPLAVGETYPLTVYSDGSAYGEFIIFATNQNTSDFLTNETVVGAFKITRHDFDNAILSGTFWFDAVNSLGEIVEIREGRFDTHY